MTRTLRIGFIPLVDAAALVLAADMGFFAAEGLAVDLVREVSWSNIRDKLAIGVFDAAHLLTPMAVAARLGLDHLKVPLAAPIALALNGNAITVSPTLWEALRAVGYGLEQPVASARALREVVREREARNLEPLSFGMTFPFSTHNYLLRHWMAEGGVDPDRHLRLVVLPPPLMAEVLARGEVDGFCVGAPWNSAAVDAGLGVILHFGCEIFTAAPEKTLALRQSTLDDDPALVAALLRAICKAGNFARQAENSGKVAAVLARPERVGVDPEVILRTLEGQLRINAQGATRSHEDYLILGAGRPQSSQGAWIYAQMLRWGQAEFSQERLAAARDMMRGDVFDAALNCAEPVARQAFDEDVKSYVNAFVIGAKI